MGCVVRRFGIAKLGFCRSTFSILSIGSIYWSHRRTILRFIDIWRAGPRTVLIGLSLGWIAGLWSFILGEVRIGRLDIASTRNRKRRPWSFCILGLRRLQVWELAVLCKLLQQSLRLSLKRRVLHRFRKKLGRNRIEVGQRRPIGSLPPIRLNISFSASIC